MKKAGLWLCNLFVKVLDKQVLNILLYEVITKLIVICFENNIKCSLNVNKQIPMDTTRKVTYRNITLVGVKKICN